MAGISLSKIVDTGGVNVAGVDASGNLKVAGTFSAGAPAAVTALAPAQVTVGAVSTTVVAANASRKGLILVNCSTAGQRVSLTFDGTTAAVIDTGITLYPGGAFAMDSTSLTVALVKGISNAAGALVGVQEYQ